MMMVQPIPTSTIEAFAVRYRRRPQSFRCRTVIPRRVMVADIISAAAEHFGFSAHEIVSHRRQIEVIRARHVAMYLAREMTPMSLPDIGRRFGGRDHTTILHAVIKIGREASSDPAVASEVEAVRAVVHGRKAVAA